MRGLNLVGNSSIPPTLPLPISQVNITRLTTNAPTEQKIRISWTHSEYIQEQGAVYDELVFVYKIQNEPNLGWDAYPQNPSDGVDSYVVDDKYSTSLDWVLSHLNQFGSYAYIRGFCKTPNGLWQTIVVGTIAHTPYSINDLVLEPSVVGNIWEYSTPIDSPPILGENPFARNWLTKTFVYVVDRSDLPYADLGDTVLLCTSMFANAESYIENSLDATVNVMAINLTKCETQEGGTNLINYRITPVPTNLQQESHKVFQAYYATFAFLNNRLFIFGTVNNDANSEIFRYQDLLEIDLLSGNMLKVGDNFPYGQTLLFNTSFVMDGVYYMIGGFLVNEGETPIDITSARYTYNDFMFSPSNNSFNASALCPPDFYDINGTPLGYVGSVICDSENESEVLFIGGGNINTAYKNVYRFRINPMSSDWKIFERDMTMELDVARRHPAWYKDSTGKIYLAGGIGVDNQLLNTTSIWNPETQTWTTDPDDIFDTPRANAQLVELDGFLYLIGGDTITDYNRYFDRTPQAPAPSLPIYARSLTTDTGWMPVKIDIDPDTQALDFVASPFTWTAVSHKLTSGKNVIVSIQGHGKNAFLTLGKK